MEEADIGKKTALVAPTSIGSPSGVPVPCIWSTRVAALSGVGVGTDVDIAARITACCEGPLGAVSELLRPSWFTAAPVTHTKGVAVA